MNWRQRIWTSVQIAGLAVVWLGSGAGGGRKPSSQSQGQSGSQPTPIAKTLRFHIEPSDPRATSRKREMSGEIEDGPLFENDSADGPAIEFALADIDGDVCSPPILQSRLSGRGQVAGNSTRAEVRELCLALDSNRK
jgi:hypothetical protein